MTHLNELSKVYLDKISEALTPEQRAAAQEILNKETGADKKKAEMKAKKKRSEIRKDKELELKQANLKIRQDREARRKEDRDDRKQDRVARDKADALKAKQKDLAKNVSDKTKAAAGASKAAQASLASAKPKETITDKDGDGTALGKLGANAARGVTGVAGATINTVKSIRLRQQAKKAQGNLNKTKVQEDTLLEVDEVDSKEEKTKKVIDVMRGKNKIEVNPQIKAEGVISQVKKGVKRHKDAVEKKKIKNRKAVPYAALAAETQPEGELVEGDVHSGQGEKIQKRTLAWMKKKGQKGAPGLDAMKERQKEHEKKRGVKEEAGCETKKIENKGKKKIDPNKNPAVKEDVRIADAKGRDFLEIIDIIKPEPMKSPKNTVQWNEEKIAKLMKKANEKKRKNALQINKIVVTQ